MTRIPFGHHEAPVASETSEIPEVYSAFEVDSTTYVFVYELYEIRYVMVPLQRDEACWLVAHVLDGDLCAAIDAPLRSRHEPLLMYHHLVLVDQVLIEVSAQTHGPVYAADAPPS